MIYSCNSKFKIKGLLYAILFLLLLFIRLGKENKKYRKGNREITNKQVILLSLYP